MATGHPLSPNGITHALLDANVLLPPRLSDILFDLCLEGLFSARWSVEIEAEFLRNWPKMAASATGGGWVPSAQQTADQRAKAQRRLDRYKKAIPDHEVFGHDQDSVLGRVPQAVHAADKHVAAAGLVLLDYAHQFNANDQVYIVSSSLKHLAIADMKRLGVMLIPPGKFIDSLALADSARVGSALDKSVSSLNNPPYTRALLLDALLVHGARATARHFALAWGDKNPSARPD